MTTPQFKVGDRVQMRGTELGAVGVRGTIHHIAYIAPEAYLVLFDGWAELRLIQGLGLRRVPVVPSDALLTSLNQWLIRIRGAWALWVVSSWVAVRVPMAGILAALSRLAEERVPMAGSKRR